MKKYPYPRFSTIHQTGFIFLQKKLHTVQCQSVPIGSRHMPIDTPARGARGQSWRGCFLKSTEPCPSRCVRVKVLQRARRLKFLCLDMPCCCCCCFSHSAHLLPTRKKLLYTVANPARGLLNREKKKKKKSGSATPPPPPPRAARSEKK